MSKKKWVITGLLFFSLCIFTGYLFANDISGAVDELFGQDQTEYSNVYIPIKSIFTELQQRGLPVGTLLDKLKEGLAKKVAPQNLLNGIKSEALRIKQVSVLLKETQFPYTSESQKNELYRYISLFLLSGFQEQLLQQMLNGAKSREEAVKVFESLGTTLLKLKTITTLDESRLGALSRVLLESTLNYTSYPIITSLFVKAKFRRVSDQEMYALVINILRNGGGVLQIEEELSRRTRK